MKIDNNLSRVFDMEPVKEGEVVMSTGEVVIPETNSQNEKIENDYDRTRANLYGLLQQGQDALMHALEIAKSSEHPRAFEVVGNLMNQLADINEQLLRLHERKQKLDNPKDNKESKGETKTVTNNNAIFVGSTSELNKLIKNMNSGE
jgi:hypothetical protein